MELSQPNQATIYGKLDKKTVESWMVEKNTIGVVHFAHASFMVVYYAYDQL